MLAATALPSAKSVPMLFISAAIEAIMSGETSTYVIRHLGVY
ncbi:hypothetical protein [Mycobacterium riyadhense]|nr:hypothetical protein [Mycobacterium riyadhense]